MIGALIHLVIILLIVGVIYWAALEIMKVIPLPAPIPGVIRVVLIVIVALVIIYYGLVPLLTVALP